MLPGATDRAGRIRGASWRAPGTALTPGAWPGPRAPGFTAVTSRAAQELGRAEAGVVCVADLGRSGPQAGAAPWAADGVGTWRRPGPAPRSRFLHLF